MALKWSEDLRTGISEIDAQHIELFDRFDRLADACRKGQGRYEIDEIMAFLGGYIKMHFSGEEEWMQSLGYPGYPVHKSQHVKFMREFGALKEDFDSGGGTAELAIRVNVLVGSWLVTHINTFDKSFAVFLKNRV